MTRDSGRFSSGHVVFFIVPNRQTVGSKSNPSIFGSIFSRQLRNLSEVSKMEKRVSLGAQKKKSLKRRKKHLLRKVVDYLKFDTFMYSPLISSPESEFLPLGTIHTSTKVVEVKKPMKEKTRFAEQVGEYLKSDVYMYAPLVVPPHSPLEPLEYDGMRRKELSSRRLTMNGSQPTYNLESVNQRSECHIPHTGLSNQHTLRLKETVKHTVYQNCRSTSASGKVMVEVRTHC